MTDETPQLEVTPAAEWRQSREEGYVVRLPSGTVARLRPAPLHALFEQGKIPAPLVNIAAEVIWTGESEDLRKALSQAGKNQNGQVAAEELKQIHKAVPEWLPLAHIVCRAAFVEPRIADRGKEPEEGEITLADLEEGDVLRVWRLATRGAAVLRGFRDRQAADVAAVHDGKNVADEAQPNDGDSG